MYGLDADAIAVEVARRNAPYKEVVVSDGFEGLKVRGFQCIVSNPPIHRGKSEDHDVLHELITDSKRYLRVGGALWLVVQKRIKLRERLLLHFGEVRCVMDNGRFQVWCAR